MINVTKRGMARIIAFPSAIIMALAISLFISGSEAAAAKRTLEKSYMRSVEELSHCLENIKNTLNKGMYSNSPKMTGELSARLSNDAAAAKACLAQLPVSELNLTNTYKYLSQVGNYSKALSEKAVEGAELTVQDEENLAKLYDYARAASENMWSVEGQLQKGLLTFEKVKEIAGGIEKNERLGAPATVTDGFKEMEDSFDDYPMLIYDGPFSDHIMQKDPLMLRGENEIDWAAAERAAIEITGLTEVSAVTEEGGRMSSYVLKGGNTSVAITKAGGYLCYMLGYRDVGAERLTAEQAAGIAEKFLNKIGYSEITRTYYETRDGVCITNFAGVQDGVVLYTDLIKVGVALDTGEVISADARGYLTNHTVRSFGEPALTEKEAASKLSKRLSSDGVKLCVIPSDGMNERYCYEFKCRNSNGQQILVYINADTGAEEQIFLLEIGPNGVLTV